MSISNQLYPSHNYVPAYQQSGMPYVKTLDLPEIDNNRQITLNGQQVDYNDDIAIEQFKFEFDSVTRWFTIQNHSENGGIIKLYFNKTAAQTSLNDIAANPPEPAPDPHFYYIDAGHMTKRLEIKCKYFYAIPVDQNKSVRFSIHAGLTNIRNIDFPDQTKANGFLGVEN